MTDKQDEYEAAREAIVRPDRVTKALGTTDDLLDAIEGIQAAIKGDEMGVFQLMLVETLKLRLEMRQTK
jgi:hypothetical protein